MAVATINFHIAGVQLMREIDGLGRSVSLVHTNTEQPVEGSLGSQNYKQPDHRRSYRGIAE
ncbi:hypothetical protein D9M68_892060 [compost metagenome]